MKALLVVLGLLIGCETAPIREPMVTSEYFLTNKHGNPVHVYEHRADPAKIARYCEKHYDGLMCARWNRTLSVCHAYLYDNAAGDEWYEHEIEGHCKKGAFHP